MTRKCQTTPIAILILLLSICPGIAAKQLDKYIYKVGPGDIITLTINCKQPTANSKQSFKPTANNLFPPKTHNLIKLAKHTNLILSDEREILLDEINDFNLEARYPQFKNEFHKKCDKDFTDN